MRPQSTVLRAIFVLAVVGFLILLASLPLWALYCIAGVITGGVVGLAIKVFRATGRWARRIGIAIITVSAVIAVGEIAFFQLLGPTKVGPERLIRVDYRGEARIDSDDDVWRILHRIALDSATARLPQSVPDRSKPDLSNRGSTLTETLVEHDWRPAGSEDTRSLFEQSTSAPVKVPSFYRLTVVDSIIIPSLGRRLGNIVLLPSNESTIDLLAPEHLLVESYPPFRRSYPTLSGGYHRYEIPLSRIESRLTVVRLRVTGPLFRTALTAPIARFSLFEGFRWAVLLLWSALGLEISRRVGEPIAKRVLDFLQISSLASQESVNPGGRPSGPASDDCRSRATGDDPDVEG